RLVLASRRAGARDVRRSRARTGARRMTVPASFALLEKRAPALPSPARRRAFWRAARRRVPRGWIVAKRAFDLAASATLLVAFAPLMALIALAVKAVSPGPALFSQ